MPKSKQRSRSVEESSTKSSRRLRIPGDAIKLYLEKEGITQSELAKRLNVTTTSLARWTNPSDDAPTSTTIVVLIPLLLAAGIDTFITEPTEKDISDEFADLRGVVDEQEVRSNPAKFAIFKKRVALKNMDEYRKAKVLYEMLKTAWDPIENNDTKASDSDKKLKKLK